MKNTYPTHAEETNDTMKTAKIVAWTVTTFAWTLLPLGLAVVCSGCLFMGGGDRVEIDEERRYRVQFSSVEAARVFHRALEASDHDLFVNEGGFMIPFVAFAGGSVFHETDHYNAQVRLADVDRNGEITEEEASAYEAYVDESNEDEDDE